MSKCWDVSADIPEDDDPADHPAQPCGRAALPGPWKLCEQHEETHRRDAERAWDFYAAMTPNVLIRARAEAIVSRVFVLQRQDIDEIEEAK